MMLYSLSNANGCYLRITSPLIVSKFKGFPSYILIILNGKYKVKIRMNIGRSLLRQSWFMPITPVPVPPFTLNLCTCG